MLRARGGSVFRPPCPREPLAQGEAGGGPSHSGRVAPPVPGLRRRGRPPRPVAAQRDRRRSGVRHPRTVARRARLRGALRRRRPRCRTTGCRHFVAGDRLVSSPGRYPRTARLNEVMLEVLAEQVERLSDPRLGFVTLTSVDVNRDLSKANVYYSTLGGTSGQHAETNPDETAAALESATPHLRRVLGREVRVKQVPRLVFLPDPAIESGERIETILRDIRSRDGAERAGEDAGE